MEKLGVPYIIVVHHNLDVQGAIMEPYVYGRAMVDVLPEAARVAFVAEGNRKAAYRQLASHLPDACVVRNAGEYQQLGCRTLARVTRNPALLASVARLDIRYKGQDILLEVLAGHAWRDRSWRLRIYGRGPDLALLGGPGRRTSSWPIAWNSAVTSATSMRSGRRITCWSCRRGRRGRLWRWSRRRFAGGLRSSPTSGAMPSGSRSRPPASSPRRRPSAPSVWLWSGPGRPDHAGRRWGSTAHREAVAKADPEPGRSLLELLAEVAGQVPTAGVPA